MLRLLVLVTTLCFSLQTFAAECGLFRVVKGDVSYQQKNKDKFRQARVNKKVCAGDTVKTGADARAKIEMADGNEINLSPESQLLIEQYERNAANNEKKVLLNVLYGKIRSNVKEKYQDDDKSHYRVKTKSAVAGVRGTEFLTSFNAKTNQTRVVTFEGEVAVGRFQKGKFIAQVRVTKGQFTSNTMGSNPHSPRSVPPQEFAQMQQDTNFDVNLENRDVATDPTDGASNSDDAKPDDTKNDQPANDAKPNEASPSDSSQDSAKGREPSSTNGDSAGLPEPKLPEPKNSGPETVQLPKPPIRTLPDTRIPVCTTCNNIIQNRKVKVTIVPVLPGQ